MNLPDKTKYFDTTLRYQKGIEEDVIAEEKNQYNDLIKQQRFDKLLDKEIQLENAKNQALRHSQTQLAAQGFSGQGYGDSMQSGIYGRYIEGFNELNREYQNDIENIELQQQANNEESYQQLVGLITQGNGNMNRVNELLQNYNYGTIDSNGNFVWNEEKPENISQEDWTQLKYIYGLQNDSSVEPGANYGSFEQLANGTYINGNGDVSSLGKDFNREINTLWHYATQGTYKKGDVIKLTNDHGTTVFLERTSNGFKPTSKKTATYSVTYKNGKIEHN